MSTLGTQDFRMINDRDIADLAVAAVQRIEYLGAATSRSIRTWVRRSNERRALSQLNGRLLDDIGLTRAEIEREARKYFWQK